MPEEFAFQEFGGETCTVNGDQRMGGTRAAGMDRPGQDFLADTAFATEQDGRLAGRGLESHVERLADARLACLEFHLGRQPGKLLVHRVDWRGELRVTAGSEVLLSKLFKRRVVSHEDVHGGCLSLLSRTAVHFARPILQSAVSKGACRLRDIRVSSIQFASCVFWHSFGTPHAIEQMQIRCRCTPSRQRAPEKLESTRSKSYGPDSMVARHDPLGVGGIRLDVRLRTRLRQDLKGYDVIALTWLTAAATLLLLIYLFAALVRPEWF